MKNKILLSVFLLTSVINLQSSNVFHYDPLRAQEEKKNEVAIEATVAKTNVEASRITAKEYSELVFINESNKKLAELNAKSEKTEKDKKMIINLKEAIAKYDEVKNHAITELKKDASKNAALIKALEEKKSDKVTDKALEEAKKGLTAGSKACYFTWYKNRILTCTALAMVVGLSMYEGYRYLFNNYEEDQEEDADEE